jgi:hypothetical protein
MLQDDVANFGFLLLTRSLNAVVNDFLEHFLDIIDSKCLRQLSQKNVSKTEQKSGHITPYLLCTNVLLCEIDKDIVHRLRETTGVQPKAHGDPYQIVK